MGTQKLFRPGQNVVWGDRNKTMELVTRDEGPGPFNVLMVEDIPEDKCSCGGSFDDEMHQYCGKCPFDAMGHGPVRKSVGHPQWVTIDSNGRRCTFSGAYFKAV